MAWKKSHKWILEPTTRLERKHILDLVRENHHTVMVHPKKYFDSDNGKYDIDRIETINSHALSEFCDNGAYTHPPYNYRNDDKYDHIPYFVPKDNDFDEECRRDEEEKERKRINEERKKEEEKRLEELRIMNEVMKINHNLMVLEKNLEINETDRLWRQIEIIVHSHPDIRRKYDNLLNKLRSRLDYLIRSGKWFN